MRIKKGDMVKILSGKDKGREVKVEGVLPKENELVLSGVNMYKKHVKGRDGQKGGIYDLSKPMSVSKVGLICPSCKKVTKVGFRYVKDEKVRYCKKCSKEIITK